MPNAPQARHRVAVLAPRGAVGFDVSAACQAFALVRLGADGEGPPPYEVRVCGAAPVVVTAAGTPCYALTPTHPLHAALGADTIVVPGTGPAHDGAGQPTEPEVTALLRRAAARGIRLASICTGAFLLAEAGVLDGLRATTHWLAAERLARAHPRVRVDAGALFTDNGQVLTSAGLTAGIDLCLHLVSRDHGAAVAARAARALVVPLRREGQMAQLLTYPPTAAESGGGGAGGPVPLAATLEWLHRNLHRPLTIAAIARRAGLSVRHLHRRFAAETGTTPMRWLLWARTERARELLETTDLPVEHIAAVTGFGSAVSLRVHFRRRLGVSPSAYRRTFRAARTG